MEHTSLGYEIRIEGTLGQCWEEWFDHLQVIPLPAEPPQTILKITIDDPVLLHGVLAQIGAMNLRLIRVEQITEASQVEG